MGLNELHRLKASISYQPAEAGNIDRHLQGVVDVAGPFTTEMGLDGSLVASRFEQPDLASALKRTYECVRLLVGSELDTASPGDRGLGRVTTATKRFGAVFRDLDVAAIRALGSVMERICIHGFGTAAVYGTFAHPDELLRERDPDEVAVQWVARGIGTGGWNNSVWALLDACVGDAIADLKANADQLGLIRGLRGKKKAEAVEACGVILAAGGFNLLAAQSPRNDDWYA